MLPVDPAQRLDYNRAVEEAARLREAVWLVLPDGRRGIIEIDFDWFEGVGPWPEEVA